MINYSISNFKHFLVIGICNEVRIFHFILNQGLFLQYYIQPMKMSDH